MIPSRIKRYGLYRLYWNEGGFSLASVGGDRSGRLWFAPCNWISGPSFDWGPVKRAVFIDLGPVRGTVVRKPKKKPARPIVALLRDIILLDGDESNPFGGGEPRYVVPSLGNMAGRAARILGTTREAVLQRAELAKLWVVVEAAARLQRWNDDDRGGDDEGEAARRALSQALDAACPGWRAKEAGR